MARYLPISGVNGKCQPKGDGMIKRTRVCMSIMFVLVAALSIAAIWTQMIPQYQGIKGAQYI